MTVLTEIPPQVNIADEVELAIETYELGKIYRTGFWMNQKVESLKKCTLQVDRGETFGLLGLNGAGKTTLLKSLLGIVRPTSGKGKLLGKPLGDRAILYQKTSKRITLTIFEGTHEMLNKVVLDKISKK